MVRLAIIADDLTGALDAAAPLASIAGGAVVATSISALAESLARRPGVVAVSTRSREIDPNEARARVASVLGLLPAGLRIVKKVDSRLKGNVAAELAAFGPGRLLVAPAIPEFGRIVRAGAVRGFGIDRPLPLRPLLGDAAARADIPDTVTPAEMIAAVRDASEDTTLVGARGLCLALAAVLGLPPATSPAPLPLPLCLAIGSTDPITLRQIAALRAARPDLVYVPAAAGRLETGWDAVPDAVSGPGAPAPVTLLQITPAHHTASDTASDPNSDAASGDRPAETARRFATGAAPWLAAARSMVLSGGATAEACLDAMGIRLLALRGEALPGLPLSEVNGRLVVTKSGGFGEADALARLAPRRAAAET